MSDETQQPDQDSVPGQRRQEEGSAADSPEGAEIPPPAGTPPCPETELPEFPWAGEMTAAGPPAERASPAAEFAGVEDLVSGPTVPADEGLVFPWETQPQGSPSAAAPPLLPPDDREAPAAVAPPLVPSGEPQPAEVEAELPAPEPAPLADLVAEQPASTYPETVAAENASLPWENQPQPSVTAAVGDRKLSAPAAAAQPPEPALGPEPAALSISSAESPACPEKELPGTPAEGGSQPPDAPCEADASEPCIERIAPSRQDRQNTLAYGTVVQFGGSKTFIDVLVEHRLPAGVRYLGADPPAKTRGDRLTWHLGKHEPGSKVSLQVLIELPPDNEIPWEDLATFQLFYCHKATQQTRVTRPRLVLSLNGPENLLVGEEARFLVEARNTGNWPAVGVRVCSQLPPALQPLRGEAIEADLGSLLPGETVKLVLRTQATQAGRWESTFVATSKEGLKAAAQGLVVVTAPALELRLGTPPPTVVGREAGYRLELSNPGTAPATGVQVVDSLPEELEFISASAGGRYDPARRQISWSLESLPPGQSKAFSVRLRAETPGDFLHEVSAQADRGLVATAQGEVRYDIDESQGSHLLEKFVALMDEEAEPLPRPEDLIRQTMSRRATTGGKEDQYVVFTVAGTDYAVAIGNVLEVAPPLNITPLPNVPDWMVGVTNMRGDVVSIVDLRAFLGMGQVVGGQGGRMVVVRASGEDMVAALIVDRVREICRLPAEQISAPASPVDDPVAPYLRGVCEYKGRLLVLLDVDRLLLSAEMRQFEPV